MKHIFYKTKSLLSFSVIVCLVIMVLGSCIKSKDLQLTPYIEHVSPDSLGKGATLLLKGRNFSFSNATTSVSLAFEGPDTLVIDALTMFNYLKAEEIRMPLPELTPGYYNIYLIVNDRDGNRRSNTVRTKVIDVFVSSIEPLGAVVGETVIIKGSGLKTVTKVRFATRDFVGVEVDPVEPPTNDEVKVVIPPGAVPGQVVLKAAGADLYGPQYHVKLPKPVINSTSATVVNQGDKIVIAGNHFGPDRLYSHSDFIYPRKVWFTGANGTRVAGAVSIVVGENSETITTAFVPLGAVSGPVVVEVDGVQTPGGINLTVNPVSIAHGFVSVGSSGIVLAAVNQGHLGAVFTIYPTSEYISALHADPVSRKVFFCESGVIRSVNFDGTGLLVLVQADARQMYVINQQLYWVNSDHRVYRSEIDGTNESMIADRLSESALHTELSPDGATVLALEMDYNTFTFNFLKHDVQSQTTNVLYSNVNFPSGAGTEFNLHNQKMYINGLFEIYSLPADGSGSLSTIASGLSYVSAISVDPVQSKLLFIDNQQVFISELDGSNSTLLLHFSDHPGFASLYRIKSF